MEARSSHPGREWGEYREPNARGSAREGPPPPDLSFAHRLGVGRGGMVAADPVHVGLGEMPPHASAPAGRGALAPQRAGGTGGRRRSIDAPLRALAVAQETQGLTTRTGVGIRCRVVAEVLIPELSCPVADLRQGEVGADP